MRRSVSRCRTRRESTNKGAAWLAAVTVIHDQLGERYRAANLRFAAAADNANLQLVRSPFDGRRSIMTRVGTADADLVKVPAYGFYELLRLLGDRHGTIDQGSAQLFPHTDLYHLVTVAATHVASLLMYYPDREVNRSFSGRSSTPSPTCRGLGSTSLGFRSTGFGPMPIRRPADRHPTRSHSDPAQILTIRESQEVALERPIVRDVAVLAGTYAEMLALEPFTTLCLWITPVQATVPQAPMWLESTMRNGNAVLRWSPNKEPFFYSYEVFRLRDGLPIERLTPDPFTVCALD